MGEKFQSEQTVNVFKKMNTVPKATKTYNFSSTFVPPIYTFLLTGTIFVYRPLHGTIKNGILFNTFMGEMPTLVVKLHLSVLFFLPIPHLFYLSTEKNGCNPSETDIKMVIPAPTQQIIP